MRSLVSVVVSNTTQEVDIIKKCQNKMKRLLEKVDIQLKYVTLLFQIFTLTLFCETRPNECDTK